LRSEGDSESEILIGLGEILDSKQVRLIRCVVGDAEVRVLLLECGLLGPRLGHYHYVIDSPRSFEEILFSR
jgi:hypothetical protein